MQSNNGEMIYLLAFEKGIQGLNLDLTTGILEIGHILLPSLYMTENSVKVTINPQNHPTLVKVQVMNKKNRLVFLWYYFAG